MFDLGNLDLAIKNRRGGGGGGGASPVLYTYDFVANPTLPATFSLSRATTGTRFNSSGVLVTEAINAARFDYSWNGSLWLPTGLLIEEQRTNVVRPGDSTGWNSNNGAGITTAAGISPDGTNDAVKVTSPAATGTFRGTYGNTTGDIANATTYTYSHLAKSNGIQWLFLDLYDGTINNDVWFDLINGVVGGASAGSTGAIRDISNGWYDIIHVRTSTSVIFLPGLYPADANSSPTFTSTGSNGPLESRVQVEAGSFPTSFIPTTTVAVTRSADLLSAAGALVAQLAAGPSVWELTDLATGVTSRASFAAGAFAFPNNKRYRSMGVYPPGTDTSPYLTVGAAY
jgi:hypothetical protein